MTDLLKTFQTSHGVARWDGFGGAGTWAWQSEKNEGLPAVDVSMVPADELRWSVVVRVAGVEQASKIHDCEGDAFAHWAQRVEVWNQAIAAMLIMRDLAPELREDRSIKIE